ncbi:hypothetical protein ILYODFUR_036032 [Ilyodon furcidens]|uniref:Uncharacterized protein n=1 Tax=Ilyodon furcidens TaxID=33524 RepID=A0ABV0V900_9TELE
MLFLQWELPDVKSKSRDTAEKKTQKIKKVLGVGGGERYRVMLRNIYMCVWMCECAHLCDGREKSESCYRQNDRRQKGVDTQKPSLGATHIKQRKHHAELCFTLNYNY